MPPRTWSRTPSAACTARLGAAALVRILSRWTWTRGQRLAVDQFGAPAIAWSDLSGRRLLVLQPRDGANRLGVLTGGRLMLTGDDLLPARPEAYARLQASLPDLAGVPPHMTW